MKKKSKRFQPLARIAGNKEYLSAKQLAQSQIALNEQVNKLKELNLYKEEYIMSFKKQGELGMDGAQLQTYQKFIQNIDGAIVQQQNIIKNAKINCEKQKNNWKTDHTKTRVINNVIKQYQNKEQKTILQQEQNEHDECSSRINKVDTDN